MRADIPVEIASLSFEFKSSDSQCRIVNISCSGLYCQVDRFVPLFTTLNITLAIPKSPPQSPNTDQEENTITCRGIVVRTEPSHPVKGCNEYHIAVFVPNGIPIDPLSDVTFQ